jgi:subtilisin
MDPSGRGPNAERDGEAGVDHDGEAGHDAEVDRDGGSDHDAVGTADTQDTEDAEDIENTEDAEGAGDDEGTVEVGDDREKYVEVLTRSGERTEHVEAYLRHTTDEFVVSADESFPADATTRYPKADLLRVEITQHHSACFITTATVGEDEVLDSLRAFRDDVLRRTPIGKGLVGVYYRISPPVARTLSRHPSARTTRLVRRLVRYSGALARRRADASSASSRSALALALTLVYVLGVCCALAGHAAIRLRESLLGVGTARTNA